MTNSVTCVTGDRNIDIPTNNEEEVRATYDNQEVVSDIKFTYIDNANVTSVSPVKGIVSGGIKIRVKGTNLEYVQQAQMVFQKTKMRRRRRSVTEFTGVRDV